MTKQVVENLLRCRTWVAFICTYDQTGGCKPVTGVKKHFSRLCTYNKTGG